MKTYIQPPASEWERILKRPTFDHSGLESKVDAILNDVRERGDRAVRDYTRQFDQVSMEALEVTPSEMERAAAGLSDTLKKSILTAKNNIERFHAGQRLAEEPVETMPGVRCWRKSVGIEKVGLYIPGGTAPLFSTVLMLGVPAKLAGCQEIILCSPPDRNQRLHPAILFAARVVGIDRVFKAGGVQAIGAMAYGTESIPKVYKIFGPGNQYVTTAKQLISRDGIAIDMPAGPSEVLVCADDTANPAFVAADLLSQAEHGTDSQVVLLGFDPKRIEEVQRELQKQLQELPRREIAAGALENSCAIVVNNRREAVDLINSYAPEHLILAVKEADEFAERIINAGSVFLGNYTPESVGDYASGTNHTLPTNGYAKAYSGVSLDSFVKKITFQRLSREGLELLGPAVEQMAEAEELIAHKKAVSIRLNVKEP